MFTSPPSRRLGPIPMADNIEQLEQATSAAESLKPSPIFNDADDAVCYLFMATETVCQYASANRNETTIWAGAQVTMLVFRKASKELYRCPMESPRCRPCTLSAIQLTVLQRDHTKQKSRTPSSTQSSRWHVCRSRLRCNRRRYCGHPTFRAPFVITSRGDETLSENPAPLHERPSWCRCAQRTSDAIADACHVRCPLPKN